MTILTAKNNLRNLLDETIAGYYSDDQLYTYLDMSQMIIAELLITRLAEIRKSGNDPNFRLQVLEGLITTDPSNATAIGTTYQEYNLPSDFLFTDYAEYSSLGDTVKYPAILLPYGQLVFREGNTFWRSNSKAPSYYIRGSKIGFFPQPSGSGANNYLHHYYKRPLTASSGNSASSFSLGEGIHDAIVQMALSMALKQDDRYQESLVPNEIALNIIKVAQ